MPVFAQTESMQDGTRPASATVGSNDSAGASAQTQRRAASARGPVPAFPGAPLPEPQPEIVSWFRSKGDDLGRSVTQHKPLNKGPYAQAGLAKSFADTEAGQRPRVWAPAEVHKPSTSLITADIEGAQSKPKVACNRSHARDTNPVDPRYKLPSCQPLSTDPILQTHVSDPVSNPQRPPRNTMQTSDIEGSAPQKLKHSGPQISNTLDISDIEGAAVGWKPNFRSHVGVRLRDPGLDVSDINGPATRGHLAPRRPDDPLVWSTGTLNQALAPSIAHTLGATAAQKARTRPFSAEARLSAPTTPSAFQGKGPEFTGLPFFQQPRPQDGLTSAPTTGEMNARKMQEEQRIAAAVSSLQHRKAAQVDAQIHLAQVERRRLHNLQAHQLRVSVADEQRAARRAAEDATAALSACVADSQKNVGALYRTWQAKDREASGKLTGAEFGQALHALKLQVPPDVLKDLIQGLSDTAGLVPYRDLAKVMLRQTQERSRLERASSARKQQPPPPTQPTNTPTSQPPHSPNQQHPHQSPPASPPPLPPTSGEAVSAPQHWSPAFGVAGAQASPPSHSRPPSAGAHPSALPLTQQPNNTPPLLTSLPPPSSTPPYPCTLRYNLATPGASAGNAANTGNVASTGNGLAKSSGSSRFGRASSARPLSRHHSVPLQADHDHLMPADHGSTGHSMQHSNAAADRLTGAPASGALRAPSRQGSSGGSVEPHMALHHHSQRGSGNHTPAQLPHAQSQLPTTLASTPNQGAPSGHLLSNHSRLQQQEQQVQRQQQQEARTGGVEKAGGEEGATAAAAAAAAAATAAAATGGGAQLDMGGPAVQGVTTTQPDTYAAPAPSAASAPPQPDTSAAPADGAASVPTQPNTSAAPADAAASAPPQPDTSAAPADGAASAPAAEQSTGSAAQQSAHPEGVAASGNEGGDAMQADASRARKRSPDLHTVPLQPREVREAGQAWGVQPTQHTFQPGMHSNGVAPQLAWPADAAALEAGVVPQGGQVMGPNNARYYTYKGRNYWFAGSEDPRLQAAASADYKPLKDMPPGVGRTCMVSQGPQGLNGPDGEAPEFKGQKEANNGLLAAMPSGGSLGATLYHTGGHGAGTFMAAVPSTHPRRRAFSAHNPHRAAQLRNPTSSSITSVANSGAGPAMQRLDKVNLRDELRAVRLLS